MADWWWNRFPLPCRVTFTLQPCPNFNFIVELQQTRLSLLFPNKHQVKTQQWAQMIPMRAVVYGCQTEAKMLLGGQKSPKGPFCPSPHLSHVTWQGKALTLCVFLQTHETKSISVSKPHFRNTVVGPSSIDPHYTSLWYFAMASHSL